MMMVLTCHAAVVDLGADTYTIAVRAADSAAPSLFITVALSSATRVTAALCSFLLVLLILILLLALLRMKALLLLVFRLLLLFAFLCHLHLLLLSQPFFLMFLFLLVTFNVPVPDTVVIAILRL